MYRIFRDGRSKSSIILINRAASDPITDDVQLTAIVALLLGMLNSAILSRNRYPLEYVKSRPQELQHRAGHATQMSLVEDAGRIAHVFSKL